MITIEHTILANMVIEKIQEGFKSIDNSIAAARKYYDFKTTIETMFFDFNVIPQNDFDVLQLALKRAYEDFKRGVKE